MTLLRKTAVLLAVTLSLGQALAHDSKPSGLTLDGIPSNCNAFYTIKPGDSWEAIQKMFDILLPDFLQWNPLVSHDCKDHFWAEYSYCVGIDPDQPSTSPNPSSTSSSTSSSSTSKSTDSTHSTHSTHPTHSTSTRTNSTTTVSGSPTPTPTHSSSHAGNTTTKPYSTRWPTSSYNLTAPYTATAWPPEHTLGGQPESCTAWYQVRARDSCERIVNQHANRLTMEQLIEYNPTLKDCTRLYVGWYICLAVKSTITLSLPWYTRTNATIPSVTPYVPAVTTIVPAFTAEPQASGIPRSCQDFFKANEGDSCGTVLKQHKYLSKEQFFKWNPSLKGNCHGLKKGYYYCVANFTPENMPLPPTVAEADASPTASGTIAECKSWFQAAGINDCAEIAAAFGTFSEKDFISWNPSVGAKCQDIQKGTYYCVALPDTPTTRTNIPTRPTKSDSMPTQTGVPDECTRYWFVSSSDTCKSIISKTGVTPDDFHQWNPAVGQDCAGLKPNYYVCVSTSKRLYSTGGALTTLTGSVTSAPSQSATASATASGTSSSTEAG